MKVRVIVPLRVEPPHDEVGVPNDYGAPGWILKLLVHYDLTPIFVAAPFSTMMLDQLCQEAGGLLLFGGSDIDPSFYNASRHPRTNGCTPERDRIELSLVERFEKEGKPILGICRGHQLLGVASGGELYQHVPDIVPDEVHSDDSVTTDEHLPRAPKHLVQLEKDSRIAKLIGGTSVSVNSAHHQSIKRVGNWLRIVGRTPGGIVEFVEHVDAEKFVVGIQAHPEIEPDGVLAGIFRAFAEQAAKKGAL